MVDSEASAMNAADSKDLSCGMMNQSSIESIKNRQVYLK
jgi:hypothetical protein